MAPLFLQNPLINQVFAFSCVFFAASASACLLKMLVPFPQKKSRTKKFAPFCLFLSLSIIFYTLLIFAVHSLFWFQNFHEEISGYYKTLVFVFAISLLISFFWKLLLPLSLVLYVLLSFFTNRAMLSIFGRQNQLVTVRVEDNSDRTLPLVYCHLPETFLLPLRRNWIYIGEYLPSVPAGENSSAVSKAEKLLAEFVIQKSTVQPHKILLPESQLLPSLFSVRMEFSGSELKYSVVRDL